MIGLRAPLSPFQKEEGECISIMGHLKPSWTKLLNLYSSEMIINEREFNGVSQTVR